MMPTTAHDEEPAATGCEVVRQRADALLEEFGALMADISRDPDRPDLARRMVTMAAALREVRAAVSGHALADDLADAIEARAEARGYQRGLAAAGQRRGRHASQGSFIPRLVQVLVLAAGGAAALLRRSLSRHPVLAAAKASLTAHKIAALTTSVVAAGGTAAVLTVTALVPSATLPFTGSSAGAAPAASAPATPFPSSSPVALLTKPKPKHAGGGKRLLASAGLPLPVYVPGTVPASSSAPSSAPSPAVSVQAGPAVLSVSATSLDLSNPLDPQADITLSASGAGWVSWRVSTTGPDLDFSQSHGVLQAGQSYVLTVSVDPAQSLDGNASQTFDVNGQQVSATLPPLVPVPAVSVSIPPLVPSPSSS